MSVTLYKQIVRFLDYVMSFLIILPVFLVALVYFADLSLSWTLLGPAAAILLLFVLQEFCHNLLVFTLGSFLYFAAPLPLALWAGFPDFAGMTLEQILLLVVYLVFALVLFVYSFVLKLRKRETVLARNLPMPALVIPILVQILCLPLGLTQALPWILASAVILLVLRFINEYLIGYIAFLEEVRDASEVPVGQIVSSNSWLLSLFFLLAIAIMAVACFIPLDSVLPGAGKALLAVWNFIVRILRRLFTGGRYEKDPSLSEEITDIKADMSAFGESEESPFLDLLEQLMIYLVIGVLVIGVVALIAYLIYKMIKAFYSKKRLDTDLVEFLNPFDKKEKAEHIEDPSAMSFWERLFGNSPDQRIRKSWYKLVRHRLPDVSAPMSPGEITQGMTPNKSEHASAAELQSFYEKARYSNQECTKEDVAAAKQLANQLKSGKNVVSDNPLLRNRES